MGQLLGRACRYRYAVLAVVAALIWLDTASVAEWEGTDWHFFLDGARSLTGDGGLHVYAAMPYLQFGPIALSVAVALRDAGPHHGWIVVSAIGMLLGLVSVRLLERAAIELGVEAARAARCVLLAGPFFLATWASPAVSEGHPDDVLALLAVAVAVRMLATGRWAVAATAVGIASAAKPWALLVLPLAAACEGRRARGVAVAVAVAVAPWLPFLVVDSGTRRVGAFHLGVEPTSTLHYLGMAVGSTPSWPRAVQFAVAVLLGTVAVMLGRWPLVPLIAFAVRINLDPATIDYYAAGPVLGALAWDLVAAARLPVRTIVAWFALLYLPSDLFRLGARGAAYGDVVVALRAVVLVAACIGVARGRKVSAQIVPIHRQGM